jgi:hypothetical protein
METTNLLYFCSTKKNKLISLNKLTQHKPNRLKSILSQAHQPLKQLSLPWSNLHFKLQPTKHQKPKTKQNNVFCRYYIVYFIGIRGSFCNTISNSKSNKNYWSVVVFSVVWVVLFLFLTNCVSDSIKRIFILFFYVFF